MSKYSHVMNVFILVGLAFLGFQMFQALLAPDSFGQYGRYRGDHLLEASSLATIHKGDDYCLDCHEPEWDMADAKHANVPCESCHFLPKPHAIATDKADPAIKAKADGGKYVKLELMPIDKTEQPCLNCHIFLPSRPAKFPQIKDQAKHKKDGWKKTMGEVDTKAPCGRCHNSHFPKAFSKGVA
ncbi:MAG: hypothetical protein OEZ55_00645 [Nitrospinota bacterium]|nr:hypothetical protein [Nitrospinota bacterium]MDH5755161.1 hypothetical protein [Nitrospinota bacterium]